MTTDQQDAGALPAGPRPGDRHIGFFDDPITDHLLRAVVTLASELSVTRDRLATVEALLAQAGVLDRAAIDRRLPEGEEAVAREAARQKLISDLLAPLVSSLGRAS
jgi:hypothetical protein